jgi:peptidyl-prolyl cis-trans isomerase C
MIRVPRNSIRVAVVLAAGVFSVLPARAQEGTEAPAPEPPATAAPAAAAEKPSPAAPPAATGAEAAELPAVVAKVNGKNITKDELLEEAAATRQQIVQMGRGPDAVGEGFYRQVLDQVVAGVLVFQEAEEKGYAATDEEVAARIAELRSRLGSDEEFDQALSAQGMSRGELEANFRRNLTVQKFLEHEVLSKVAVSEEAEREFYQQNLERMKGPQQVRVSHVLIAVEPEAGEDEKAAARKEAEEVRTQVESGADLGALAKEHSDDPGSKEKGGELPWLAPGQAVEPFEKAAFALEPGQVSGVVESPFGFHVIKLHEKKEAGTRPFEEVQGQIASFLKQREAQGKVQALVDKLRAEARVEIFI